MISFYPGPSRVYDEIPKYVKEAHRKGVLSINHRSEEFMNLYEETVILLKSKLTIPDSYKIFFTSSATECWEIIAQSFIITDSLHIFNGAFG
jgi:phosphoserine aminotransferase